MPASRSPPGGVFLNDQAGDGIVGPRGGVLLGREYLRAGSAGLGKEWLAVYEATIVHRSDLPRIGRHGWLDSEVGPQRVIERLLRPLLEAQTLAAGLVFGCQ